MCNLKLIGSFSMREALDLNVVGFFVICNVMLIDCWFSQFYHEQILRYLL